MKVLLLANNIKWRSLDKRITELEKTLVEKISFVHDTVSITRQDISTDIQIDSWNKHLDAIWYRKNYILDNKDKYDAIGMVITKSDWVKAGGRNDLGGFYIVNSDTTHSFYIICNEKSTDRNGALEFEEYIEHELLGHGLNKEFGFVDVNDTGKFIEGKDNTHYFFYQDTKENHYMYLEKLWKLLSAKLESKIQKARDLIAQLGKKEIKATQVPISLSNRLELDFEALRGVCEILYGYNLRIVSDFRSFDEQTALYSKGRTKQGKIVTNAKAGQSLHNYGVAIDIVDRQLGYDIDFKKVAHIWDLVTDFKGEWGGSWVSFVDKPHFQNTLGYTLKDFQEGKVDYSKFD